MVRCGVSGDTPGQGSAGARGRRNAQAWLRAQTRALADANPTKPVPVAGGLRHQSCERLPGSRLHHTRTVLTHDDNVGRVYEIDPKTGILLKGFSLEGGVRGDFEAITIAGTDVYLLKSSGKIYKFKEGADASQVPYSVYDTGLGKGCEFESMAYEADSSRLLLVCKKFLDKKAPKELLIYHVPLPLGDPSAITALQVLIKGRDR